MATDPTGMSGAIVVNGNNVEIRMQVAATGWAQDSWSLPRVLAGIRRFDVQVGRYNVTTVVTVGLT